MQMLNTSENSNNKTKSKNGISFWAFLLSIFIYIAIFYIFSLSPLALFNTTKFWFFISNTLILIIAADFGAFSSSRKHDYYEEYVNNSQVIMRSTPPSFGSHYNFKLVEAKAMEQETTSEKPQEKVKDIVVVTQNNASHEEKSLEVIVKDDPKNAKDQNFQENKQGVLVLTPIVENDQDQAQVLEEKKNIGRKCIRSKSEKTNLVAQDEKKIQRTQSERYEHHEKSKKNVEENDFSAMSDEELNRRVEEFIQNFNRQIRLQAVRNRQNQRASYEV